MKRRRLQPNNRGFSLVELLVAVFILGIVVVPLLHTFVTSAATTAKSRRLGDATLAAQSLAEAVEAVPVGSFSSLSPTTVTAYDKDWNETTPAADQTAAKYKLSFSGVGDGRFDAVVTLDGTTEYGSENAKEVTQYTPMDALFAQPGEGLDPDSMAEANYELQGPTLEDYVGDATYKISRDIELLLAEKESGSYTYICTYTYSCTMTYTASDGTDTTTKTVSLGSYPISYDFYSGTVSGDSLASLFFFFAPGEKSSEIAYNDKITVRHTSETGICTPVKVFLAAQYSDDNAISTYKPLVELKETGHVSDTAQTQTTVFFNVSSSNYNYHVYIGQSWYDEKTNYFGRLVWAQQEYRLYSLTVTLYDAGTTNEVYTLDASKLD